MELSVAISMLDSAVDAHWTKKGEPDLNALSEMTGSKVTRKQVKDLAPDLVRGDGSPAPAETGTGVLYAVVPNLQGCDPIDVMEALVGMADPEWLRNNGEMSQVFQSYKANRPAIMERRERHRARWDGLKRQEQVHNAA